MYFKPSKIEVVIKRRVMKELKIINSTPPHYCIHHLKSYKRYFYWVCKKYDYQVCNLPDIVEEIRNDHFIGRIDLQYIRSTLHLKFHSLYGYHNFNAKVWWEFCKQYNETSFPVKVLNLEEDNTDLLALILYHDKRLLRDMKKLPLVTKKPGVRI